LKGCKQVVERIKYKDLIISIETISLIASTSSHISGHELPVYISNTTLENFLEIEKWI
jgi:hypothetical protein